jgi:phosphatidylinositol kinase/protein kinase (PI-3  family)
LNANRLDDRPLRRGGASETELIQRENTQPDAINESALKVLRRVQAKLTGRDFRPTIELNVPTQVDKLIEQAHSLENLCVLYIGWCPVCSLRKAMLICSSGEIWMFGKHY